MCEEMDNCNELDEDVYEVRGQQEYRYLVQEEGAEELQFCRRTYVSPLLALSRRCILLIACGVLALLVLAGYLAYMAQTLPRGLVRVRTDCGELQGWNSGKGFSFRGIPYAAPPVGERRWRPPADLQGALCWKGLHDATHSRAHCAQMQILDNVSQVTGEEDCLHLSVWTPTLRAGAKLPVMVWIHDGYLEMQSGLQNGYCPSEELATQTGLVYVSLNYRLSAFGFLALRLLRQGSPTNTSGNYGFMDQISALRWIQRNIEVFGGDPGRVTLIGQGSGGTSVWTLMMSPLAKGLFHGAIDMSGSYVYNTSLEDAERNSLVFLNKSGCQDLPCLQKLSKMQVLQAIPWKEYPFLTSEDVMDLPTKGRFITPFAAVDGYVLPDAPFHIWESGSGYSDVPFVIGTMEQEVDFRPNYENISTWIWDDYRWFVTDKLSRFNASLPKEAMELYPPSAWCPTSDRCPERLYTTMVSDLRLTCPSNDLASRAAEALKSPVYRYIVTHTPSQPAQPSRFMPFPSRFSFHSLDALAFFRGLEGVLGPTSLADHSFQDVITTHFLHFAKTGEMANTWPRYPAHTALLSSNFTAVHNHSSARCKLWEEKGFFAYAWTS